MSAAYFWKGGQLLTINQRLGADDARDLKVTDLPCVDGFRPASDPEMRYGTFGSGYGWKHVPLEELPPEFRATLLLLGVA